MKITRNIPEQLILGDSPWSTGIGLIIFLVVLVGAGLMLWPNAAWLAVLMFLIAGVVGLIGFAVFVNRVQVVFLRAEDRLLIRRQSIFGRSATEHDLSQLTHAVVEEKRSSHRPVTLYRPTLVFQKGGEEERIPIVEVYSNEPEVHVLVDAINEWLPAANDSQSER